MEEELRYTGWEWVFAEDEAFWKAALAEDVRRIAWMSRRSAPEYCGFLEWLWRLGDLPCEVIDLTDMPVGSRHRAFSLVLLHPEEIADNGVWDRAQPLDAAARERYHGLWRGLRAENAPVRVVDAEGLRSAPITFFDQRLLSSAKAWWQKPARIIGETLAELHGPPKGAVICGTSSKAMFGSSNGSHHPTGAHRPAPARLSACHALGLDAVDHRLQFLRSVNGEHLAHVVALLVPVLEPHRPAGMVRPQLPVPLERKLACLALEYHHGDGAAVRVDGGRQRVELGVQARELACGHIGSAAQSPA